MLIEVAGPLGKIHLKISGLPGVLSPKQRGRMIASAGHCSQVMMSTVADDWPVNFTSRGGYIHVSGATDLCSFCGLDLVRGEHHDIDGERLCGECFKANF